MLAQASKRARTPRPESKRVAAQASSLLDESRQAEPVVGAARVICQCAVQRARSWLPAMALSGLKFLHVLTGSARCRRCGLTVKKVGSGRRPRFKVRADAWAARCKSLNEPNPPLTPFECPYLRAATHLQRAGEEPPPDSG
jgi:hypothetical protein